MQTLKAIIVSAPATLREQLDCVTGKMTLIRQLAAMRPGPITSTMASAKASLGAIARRWLALDAEIKEHDAQLGFLTAAKAPDLIKAYGMAAGMAAEMLLLVGNNPERIHSEAAFEDVRRLSNPGIKRKNQSTSARSRRQPTSQRRTLSGRNRTYARPPADAGPGSPTDSRRKGQGGDHSMPEALPSPRDLRISLPAAEARDPVVRYPLTDIRASMRWPKRPAACSRPRRKQGTGSW
jgi:hypothetical protein